MPDESGQPCIKDFAFCGILGEGEFGRVMMARNTGTKEFVAVKVLRKNHLLQGGSKSVKHAITEKEVPAAPCAGLLRPPVARPLVSPSVTFVGVLCGAWQVLQDLSDKQHPYIVSLHHSFQDDSHLYLVMDFVGGGLHACAIIGTIGIGPRRCFGSGLLMALGRANLQLPPPSSLPMHATAPDTARGITLPRAKV